VADGNWHHLAFVVSASGGTRYVDGVARANRLWTGTPGAPATINPLVFSDDYGLFFSLAGVMDELTLWNRALSGAEVGTVMRSKRTGTEAGLLAYWTFDEGSGSTAGDHTRHGYNGTLQFAPAWVPSDAPIDP
jgi:hypothetical protein